ncbi:MAG: FAD-dependent oxidoreductase [Planctomycetota bacterium]
MAQQRSVAVVGGGVSGLTLARSLTRWGMDVRVFDKGRGPGGRASTRREGERRFDHGAQYFTARDERFRRELATWIAEGVAAEWEGRIAVLSSDGISLRDKPLPRYVGVPGMSAIVKRLAQDSNVEFGVRIGRLRRRGETWLLSDDSGQDISSFDSVVVALPAEQASDLLGTAEAPFVERIRRVTSDPSWAVLASFDERLPVDFDGAFVDGSSVAWVSRDSSKPGRGGGERWVIHATAEWSRANLEEDQEGVAIELLAAFFEAAGLPPRDAEFLTAHRWRYAKVDQPLDDGCFWDAELSLGVCGDWCHRCRVEGAYLSGLLLAERMLDGWR